MPSLHAGEVITRASSSQLACCDRVGYMPVACNSLLLVTFIEILMDQNTSVAASICVLPHLNLCSAPLNPGVPHEPAAPSLVALCLSFALLLSVRAFEPVLSVWSTLPSPSRLLIFQIYSQVLLHQQNLTDSRTNALTLCLHTTFFIALTGTGILHVGVIE